MNLERVREFITIAETGSFKQAAKDLDLAPNVLSARFSAFEQSLGTPLLTRNAHRVELTDDGKLFIKQAKECLLSYDRSVAALKSTKENVYRSLKIQVCSEMFAPELGILLDSFCRRYPQLYLDILDDSSGSIRDNLAAENIDFAIVNGEKDAFSDIDGRLVVLRFPNLNVFVPNDHPLANRHAVHFSDLDGETFVLYPKTKEPVLHNLEKSLLKQAGISYHLYDGAYAPRFYDLFVPIGKGLVLSPCDFHIPPNTKMLKILDEGFDTYLYLLYREPMENETARVFLNEYRAFLEKSAGDER